MAELSRLARQHHVAVQIAGARGDAGVLHIKQYTLNCMGFLCEQLYEGRGPTQAMVDKLLTAIIHCMDGGSNPPVAILPSSPF